MVSSNSLDEYVGGTVKRYSSLFTLPSQERIILSLFALCVLGGVLAILPSCPSYGGFALGLMFGAIFLLIIISSDFVVTHVFMKADPVFDFRRYSALSLFSGVMWFGLIVLGSIISIFLKNPDVWIKFFLLGFFAVLLLRLMVLSTTSLADRGRVFLSSVLQPTVCAISAYFVAPVIRFRLTAPFILFIPLSISVAFLAVFIFIFFVDGVGKEAIGIPSLSLFKAFMANWTENLNMPLESLFESLGSGRDVGLSLLAFRGNKGMTAVMVVPAFHPGPFKNVGSSLFPSMIQKALENKLGGVVSVPHGLFGHGLDLSSQMESQKVIDDVLESLDFPSFKSKATPFIQVRKNEAGASCQIFGDCAFLTLTLAPETMEDLPEELNSAIANEAKERGLSSAIVVDAHNSIDGPFKLERVINPLRTAAVVSLEEALICQRLPFQVGASRIVPKEFGVKEGMGPGGISVIILKVGDQKVAYVTIDGNNMISGLREKLLLMLLQIGITNGEVLTTDTHAVNGVVLIPRGYHPIGEAIDQAKLIEYVREAAVKALNNLEPAKVSWRTETIPNIKVIGEKQVKTLCTLTEKAAKQAKKLAVTLFPTAGILLTVLLAFL